MLHPEEPLDPLAPIIDAHHHLWDRPGSRYLADDLHHDVTGSHNITRTVFVECGFAYDDGPEVLRPVGETRAVAAEARRFAELGSARIGAIVGHANMMLGSSIGDVLDAHLEAGDGLFRGIRHGTNLSDDPEAPDGHHRPTPGMMASPTFVAAARELAKRDLTFDAWVYHEQLAEVAAFAAAVPELTIVVNHMGGPLGVGRYRSDRAGTMADWRRGIIAIAQQPNVVTKIGGIGMDARFGTGWSGANTPPSSAAVAAHWQPWIDELMQHVGPDRLLCESNFPVDRQSFSYATLWNAMHRMIAGLAPADRSSILHDTAARVYRISC